MHFAQNALAQSGVRSTGYSASNTFVSVFLLYASCYCSSASMGCQKQEQNEKKKEIPGTDWGWMNWDNTRNKKPLRGWPVILASQVTQRRKKNEMRSFFTCHHHKGPYWCRGKTWCQASKRTSSSLDCTRTRTQLCSMLSRLLMRKIKRDYLLMFRCFFGDITHTH